MVRMLQNYFGKQELLHRNILLQRGYRVADKERLRRFSATHQAPLAIISFSLEVTESTNKYRVKLTTRWGTSANNQVVQWARPSSLNNPNCLYQTIFLNLTLQPPENKIKACTTKIKPKPNDTHAPYKISSTLGHKLWESNIKGIIGKIIKLTDNQTKTI